jgi:hypothetical protein
MDAHLGDPWRRDSVGYGFCTANIHAEEQNAKPP